jgi:hypothetical protein
VREAVVIGPGRAYDRGLLFSTFKTRIHKKEWWGHAYGADDVEVYLGECSENHGIR